MGELLFIATTVFVAYVVYTAIGGNKDNPEHTASQPDPTPENVTTDPEPTAPAETTPPPAPAPKPVTAKPAVKAPAKAPAAKAKAAPAKKAKPASAPATDSLKNPKTGEVAKLPGNYAFAKRWIKEALVEEGLLDKIYKNNELDSDATAKIQAALQELKAMKKYQ